MQNQVNFADAMALAGTDEACQDAIGLLKRLLRQTHLTSTDIATVEEMVLAMMAFVYVKGAEHQRAISQGLQ